MMDSPDLGELIVERILRFAAFLFTSDSMPGWMSLGLVAALAVLWIKPAIIRSEAIAFPVGSSESSDFR